MFHHWFNKKCNRVKRRHWRWLIYALCNLLLWNNEYYNVIFRSNHHCSWKFHKFHRETPVLESLFKNVAGLQAYFMFVFLKYVIIHVINLFFNDVIYIYFSVFSYSIAFLDNRLIALDIKIDKMQTRLNLIHNNLLFYDRPKICNFIKK